MISQINVILLWDCLDRYKKLNAFLGSKDKKDMLIVNSSIPNSTYHILLRLDM